MNRLSLFALAFVGANASLLNKRQSYTTNSQDDFSHHLSDVCSTQDKSGKYDMTLPCNQLRAIQYECLYGVKGLDMIHSPILDSPSLEAIQPPEMLSVDTQRICICQSQHTDLMKGCSDCQRAHGGVEGEDWISDTNVQEVMHKYCDAETTVTDSYAVAMFGALDGSEDEDTDSAPSNTTTTTYTDPIGTSTDVSLYFTPSLTGSSAYVPVLPTEGSGSSISYTSSRTSGGQIVPTASGIEEDSSSGALQKAMAHPGALGALGLAAVIAAL